VNLLSVSCVHSIYAQPPELDFRREEVQSLLVHISGTAIKARTRLVPVDVSSYVPTTVPALLMPFTVVDLEPGGSITDSAPFA
jgi:hypothetical protein